MALKIPNASEALLLSFMLGKASPGTNWTLRLYVNDRSPAAGDALNASDYTEMTTQNYAAKTLTPASWTITTPGPHALAAYAAQTFTFNGSGGDTVVYGYYITDSTSNQLVLAERFASPPTVPNTLGGTLEVTPQIQFKTTGE